MDRYLEPTKYIDFRSPIVQREANLLKRKASSKLDLVRLSFEYVRDQIDHTGDIGGSELTVKASEVLIQRTGYCYAKSHLLAGLLRANKIPAALCYQRLNLGDGNFGLHGLNTVYLEHYGWFRLDARGNRADLITEFQFPYDSLAFRPNEVGEQDGRKRYTEPLTCVIDAYDKASDAMSFEAALPDQQI